MAGYNGQMLVDSDAHVSEPPDLWVDGLPKQFTDKAPRFGGGAGQGARGGGIDPHKRSDEMAQDGVTAAVLYPTRGMHVFHLDDAALQEACCRVYNEYLADYCSVVPDRIYGIGLVSVYNIDNAIKEMEFIKEKGLVGAMIWMTPPQHLLWSNHDHYDRFWAAAESMEVPVHLHINTGFDYVSSTPQDQRGRPAEYIQAAVNERISDASTALIELIFGGVLDRYPKLTIVLAETEVGWLPFFLQHYDHNFHRVNGRRQLDPPLELLPSEYFARQMYATFLEDAAGSQAFTWWDAGREKCMWSTDYPHSRSSWPNSVPLLGKQMGHLDAVTIRKLVHDNVIRLYGLKIPEMAA